MASKKLFFHHLCLRILILPQPVSYTIKKNFYVSYIHTHELSRLRVAINVNFKALILNAVEIKRMFLAEP